MVVSCSTMKNDEVKRRPCAISTDASGPALRVRLERRAAPGRASSNSCDFCATASRATARRGRNSSDAIRAMSNWRATRPGVILARESIFRRAPLKMIGRNLSGGGIAAPALTGDVV